MGLKVDGWNIPDSWSKGTNEAGVRYAGTIRVWPVADSGFAVVAYAVTELSNSAYFGQVGVLLGRETAQRTWELGAVGIYANPGVASFPLRNEYVVFFSCGFPRLSGSEQECPWVALCLPSMRFSAIRFADEFAAPSWDSRSSRFVFERVPRPGPHKGRPVIEVAIEQLTWTEFDHRPKTKDEVYGWLRGVERPRDADVFSQIASLFRWRR